MDRNAHDETVYRLLFEKNLDGVLLLRPGGTILDANAAACSLLGMTKQEICAVGLHSIIAPGSEAEAVFEERTRTGRVSAEATFIRKDGSTFTGEFSSVTFTAGRGDAQAFVLFRDITERKVAEDALRQSEARLVQAQAVAHVGNWEIDLARQTMWGSEEAFRIYGVERNEPTVELARAQAFVLPEDRPRMDQALLDLVAGQAPYDLEFRIQRPSDGNVRVLRSTAEVVRDDDGTPLSVAGVIQDVTEQRRVEERLKLTQYAVDHARDLIIVTEPNGRIVWANGSWHKVLGYSEAEALSMNVRDTDPTLDSEGWSDSWSRMKEEGGFSKETVLVKKSGEVFPVEVSSNYLEYGGREYHIGSARDITARREAELALSRSEEQLRQSQKMQAIGQLAGGIAHDFNNLLTAILGYADILLARDWKGDELVRSDLEEIRSAADRAAALTRQILAFSRQQSLQPRLVSLNQILTELEPLLRRSLGEHIELICRPQPGLGTVEVDGHQFSQVLMNLAVNARDAMPTGGKLIFETADVELDQGFSLAHPEVAPGSYVMVSVTDTGLGMDEETIGHIFEPFFTTKEAGKGTGLGLSTVYGIIRQSGGSITVESQVGRGSTFRVYLARVSSLAIDDVGDKRSSSTSRGGETVLVVEDEASLRNLAARVLHGLGYRVMAASSGADALSILARLDSPPDLLLTDVVLPGGMSGVDLAETLRSTLPGLQVLFMSGYPRNALDHAGHIDDKLRLLQKPFTPERLAETVRDALDRRT
jgi:PAS domain S-box-containing protein